MNLNLDLHLMLNAWKLYPIFLFKIYSSCFSALGSLILAWNEALFNELLVALGMLYFRLFLSLFLVLVCVYASSMHPWSKLVTRSLTFDTKKEQWAATQNTLLKEKKNAVPVLNHWRKWKQLMTKMWNGMYMQHNSQLKMVTNLKFIDISQVPKYMSKHHRERTIQFWNEIQGWHSQLEKVVTHKKQYIQALLHLWHDSLEKLPDELAKPTISSICRIDNFFSIKLTHEKPI